MSALDPGPGETWIGGDLQLGGHAGVLPRQPRHRPPSQIGPVQPGGDGGAATQSSTAATETRDQLPHRGCPGAERPDLPEVRRASRSTPATTEQTTATPVTQPAETPNVSAAVPQAASAGGTNRRSVGPSCRGLAAPSRFPEAACTDRRTRDSRPSGVRGSPSISSSTARPDGPSWTSGTRLMAARDFAGRRSAARRCRSPHAVRPRTGIRRAGCGSR